MAAQALTTSRRTALQAMVGLSALAAVPVVCAAPADSRSIAAMWAYAVALEARVNSDPTLGADLAQLFALERAVLVGPITNRQDAAAKLKAVGLTFERGERLDGADEAALRDAIRWLEAA